MSSDLTFVEHRRQLDVYHHALASGFSDLSYVSLVSDLDAKITDSCGTGFGTTPMKVLDLPDYGPVIAKIEMGNVGGSHKARHLFGLLLRLEIDELNGKSRPEELAIASCGNAALGAATITNAVGRRLRVFVPEDANPAVVLTLKELGAIVQTCQRVPGEVGDPCMSALARAIETGSEPFTVQGPTCPEVIDGGRTLGLELARQLGEAQLTPSDLYVQVGGGALGAATMDGLLRGGVALRLHPVQPQSAHPFIAMWNRFLDRFDLRSIAETGLQTWATQFDAGGLQELIVQNADLMHPWPGIPTSIASGILDDITYDWQPLLYHLLRSGGAPVCSDEDTFVMATNMLRELVSPAPDATGAAGLAGVLADPDRHANPPVILVTGVERVLESREQSDS